MPTWKEYQRKKIGEFELVVKERTDRRNRHGATEYIITALFDGYPIHTERHDWNVWVGHCLGSLLLPEVARRAESVLKAKVEKMKHCEHCKTPASCKRYGECLSPTIEEIRKLDGSASPKVVVWAESASGTARKCVYDDGEFVIMTRETRLSTSEEWETISQHFVHKSEIRAAATFLPPEDQA